MTTKTQATFPSFEEEQVQLLSSLCDAWMKTCVMQGREIKALKKQLKEITK